jgi:hypothetical protein
MQCEALAFTAAEDGTMNFWGCIETQQNWDDAKLDCVGWLSPDAIAKLRIR